VRYLTGDSPIIANHSNMKRMLPICTKVFSKNGYRCLETKIRSRCLLESLASISICLLKNCNFLICCGHVAWCWHHLVHVVFVQAILYIDNNLNNYFTESVALGSRKRVWWQRLWFWYWLPTTKFLIFKWRLRLCHFHRSYNEETIASSCLNVDTALVNYTLLKL